jgi:molybdopterin converting factor small subunit
MKIRVRLLGLLSRDVESYNHANGLELEMQEGATYGDIVAALRLPPDKAGMFSVGGILKRRDEPVADGDEVHMFMPLSGG